MRNVALAEVAGRSGLIIDGDWVESKDQNPDGDVRLIQLADIGVGTFLDKSRRFMDGAAADRLRCTNLQPGDILVARMPDPIGRACIFPGSEQRCVTVVDVCIVRPDSNVADARYLKHLLNAPPFQQSIERYVKGSTRQRISRKNLESLQIPLPPLDEQRRIAAILDQADELRRKRREAIDRCDALRRAIFLELFVENASDSWQTLTVADVATDTRTGPFGSQLLHSEFTDDGIPVLGIDNAVSNEFRWSERRYISTEKYNQLLRYMVKPGDVLITIMGTCGRCAVVPDDIPTAINTKHLCCITLRSSLMLPVFLQAAFLQHPAILKQLGVQAKGAVMPGLNMGIIRALKLPVPPIAIQHLFERQLAAIDKSRHVSIIQDQVLRALFASLQHRAFNGEL